MSDQTVHLISPPWPLFNRPSIQLGILSAYARSRCPGIRIEPVHAYLGVAAAVGYRRAEAIARHSWLAESMFTPALFPEMTDRARRLFNRRSRSEPALRGEPFDQLAAEATAALDGILDGIDLGGTLLAGFSVCLCQWTATLYAARQLRTRAPQIPIILGGSLMAHQSARPLLSSFPEVDAIVLGEGEQPLAHLITHLAEGKPMASVSLPSVLVRDPPEPNRLAFEQLPDLAALPDPDFDDYFLRLAGLPSGKQFFPVLPVEASRGCWWRRATADGTGRGCAFCNLNGQWAGYRVKSPSRVAAEVDRLTDRYRLVDVAFTDNVLPPLDADRMAGALIALGKDLSLFGEVRANIAPEDLAELGRAGMSEIQVGIESLATRLLAKMNKGVRAIDNVAVMRSCEELGIRHGGNLIVHFPGSDDADVDETLRVIEAAAVYAPLNPVRFWLGLGSPVWQHPKAYGIRAVFNHPDYRWLVPEAIRHQVAMPAQGYRGDLKVQRRRWAPVIRRLAVWTAEYNQLRAGPRSAPILGYRDGGGFLLLRHRYSDGPPQVHRLVGPSRKIYLACRQPQPMDAIGREVSGIGRGSLEGFLTEMVAKGLMFREGDSFLSLAVRTRPCRGDAHGD